MMKINSRIIVAALVMLIGTAASAQGFGFGVKGGVAANWMPGTFFDIGDTPKTNVGFYGGAFASLDLSDVVFAQVELLYARKGVSTVNDLLGKYSRNISYVQVPVLVGFRMHDDRFSIMLGPEPGFNVGNSVKAETYNPSSIGNVRKFNLAFAIQTTYLLNDNLGIDFKFDYGITGTMENAKVGDIEDKGRNMSLQLGVSWKFE